MCFGTSLRRAAHKNRPEPNALGQASAAAPSALFRSASVTLLPYYLQLDLLKKLKYKVKNAKLFEARGHVSVCDEVVDRFPSV